MVRDHSVLRRSSADHATVQSQPSDPVQADHATPVSARCPGGGSLRHIPHVVVIVVEVVRQSLHDNGGDDGVD